MMYVMTAVFSGAFTGVLSGLLGIGGGAILVVVSVFLLGLSQHMAQAAAILAMVPTALVGVWKHHKNGLINYRVALLLAVGALVGSLVGAYIANMLSGEALRKLFSLFFGLISLQQFWTSRKKKGKSGGTNDPDNKEKSNQA